MIRAARPSERGIALVLALLMSLMIMALAASVLYVVAQSTRLSGATKRFATAAEAADGAVQAAKDAINQINWGQSATTTAFGSDGCLTAEIITGTGVPCSKTLTLPTATIGAFAATVTVERLYASDIPGGRRADKGDFLPDHHDRHRTGQRIGGERDPVSFYRLGWSSA